jgi:23S rRNA pseudouridine1911/1915/1917 synthase
MVVHPGHGNYSGTLLNALVYHFEQLPKNKDARPGLVHRLDKNTTGVMVIAKTDQALNHLGKQFFDRTIERRYVALVWGDVKEDGTVIGNTGRSLQNRKVFTVFPNGDHGKHAVTHYKVLKRFGYVTLVECKLETGRTHQIRVHMKHIGHTLFGDFEYGGDKILKGTTFSKYKQFVQNCFDLLPRQGLHAKSLAFTHPVTGEWLTFESAIPPDMQAVIEKWTNYAENSMKNGDVN